MSAAHRTRQVHQDTARITRRGFVIGALALAASAAGGRPAAAAGLSRDPFNSAQADPPAGPRYSLRLAGREVCSFQEMQLRNLSEARGQDEVQAAAMAAFGSAIASTGLGLGSSGIGANGNGKLPSGQQANDDAEPTVVLRDGTAALPILGKWYEASQEAQERAAMIPESKLSQMGVRTNQQPGQGATPDLRDAVIVKLSRADKVLAKLQIKDATVATLDYAEDGETVQKLVLTFRELDSPQS